MLSLSKTVAALQAKQYLLNDARRRATYAARRAREALAALGQMSLDDAIIQLEQLEWPGAFPTQEHERHPSQVVPFPESFACHETARAWAIAALKEQPTFAVDGSQIAPLPEFPMPIAAVQAAWYFNPHSDAAGHEKDLQMEVFVGPELQDSTTEAADVGTYRFQMEVDALISFIERSQDMQPRPVCFYDGPLIATFAHGYSPPRRRVYVEAMSSLLEIAEKYRTPLVGYVASSNARDVVEMLTSLGLLGSQQSLADASVFATCLANWGDRSVVYLSARSDEVLQAYHREDGTSLSNQIAFCYLRCIGQGAPARLEFPRWLLANRMELERVINIIRAECVVGLGYPYCIETADETAVLTGKDRERFIRLIEKHLSSNGIGRLRLNPKVRSKRRRRLGM